MSHRPTPPDESTLSGLLHADRRVGNEHAAVHKPLHPSATFAFKTAMDLVAVFQGTQPGFVYARQGNPTTASLEAKITALEGGRGTACFTTGMSAITAVLLTLLRAGDHLVSSQFLFGNTSSLLQTLQGLGVSVSFVDATDAANVQSALRPETRLVFVETIANPRTQVADLAGIGALCAAHGLVYVVDSTMTTPVLLRPREVGASLVVHSLSKGMGGHGHALGGSVTDTGLYDWSGYPNIAEPYRKGDPGNWGLQQIRKKGLRDMGATLRADDAHRIGIGIETMRLRVRQASGNALALAQWLSVQPQVAAVHYPGLPVHKQHERAAGLLDQGFGPLMSFELQAGADVFTFLDALRLVILSSHLADNRTLAIPVAHTIFWEAGAERRAAMGIADGLIRLSVGIEDVADLQADLAQALSRI